MGACGGQLSWLMATRGTFVSGLEVSLLLRASRGLTLLQGRCVEGRVSEGLVGAEVRRLGALHMSQAV